MRRRYVTAVSLFFPRPCRSVGTDGLVRRSFDRYQLTDPKLVEAPGNCFLTISRTSRLVFPALSSRLATSPIDAK